MSFLDRIKVGTILTCILPIQELSEYRIGNKSIVTKIMKGNYTTLVYFQPINFVAKNLKFYSLNNVNYEDYFAVEEEEEIL